MSDKLGSLQNQFLIAMPLLQDPNFNGSVTYLCQHNEEGAMGIVFNKPSGILLDEVLEQLSYETGGQHSDRAVLQGGPVQLDRGFVLHNDGQDWESSYSVTDTMRLTTSKDILKAIADGEGPEQFLIALGYAGWGSGQLEEEIANNAWLTCDSNSQILFETPNNQKYQKALASIGIDPSQLASKAGHA